MQLSLDDRGFHLPLVSVVGRCGARAGRRRRASAGAETESRRPRTSACRAPQRFVVVCQRQLQLRQRRIPPGRHVDAPRGRATSRQRAMIDACSRRCAIAVVATMCGLLAAGCGPRTTSSANAAPRGAAAGVVAHVEIDPAPAALERLRSRRIRVDDPVYHVSKEYEGYDVGDVIDALLGPDVRVGANVDVVFVCSDGYRARLPIANIRDGGLLATRDMSVPPDVRWQPLRQGREYMLPAPYYLVWPPRRNPAIEYPWPYRVVALELARPEERVQTSDPSVS